jgi:hypothetical protein
VIVKKMGSLQKAVKAFLAVLDDKMLDRWIPDKDWVRQIRESGENYCSVRNLNSGLAKECAWQNNHAILQGRILFYNKKSIRIKKTEGTATKNIRLCYVLSPRKPAPTVPSAQAFYQSLWDGLERSTRSLKRTAPSARTALPPPSKKAKASLSMPISPEPPSNLPLSPSAPEPFEEANQMMEEAWKVVFPSLVSTR